LTFRTPPFTRFPCVPAPARRALLISIRTPIDSLVLQALSSRMNLERHSIPKRKAVTEEGKEEVKR
jgi:hypothetical protein